MSDLCKSLIGCMLLVTIAQVALAGSLEKSYKPDGILELFQRLKEVDVLSEAEYKRAETLALLKQAEGSTTTLRQVVFLHRHGDRTPIVFPSFDKLGNEPFWTFHGLSQLTNRGKARLYMLGKIMRSRYDAFLGKSVNKNQIVTRSSGALRCIESAQAFLASFIDLNGHSEDGQMLSWDERNHLAHLWQPANVQAVPAKMDGMLAESAVCKNLELEYLNVIDKMDIVQNLPKEYPHEIEVLEKSLGYKMDHYYKWFWASSLIEVESSYFPEKMPADVMAAYERINEAGEKCLEAYQSSVKARRLRSGLLMNDMVKHMVNAREKSQSGSKSFKKFVHYSAHDLTLVVLLGMLENWKTVPVRPEYAANLALELHQSGHNWFVKIFYMQEVPQVPIELFMPGCADLPNKRCSLERFQELMAPYLIDSWQTWMKECDNDFSSLDPYQIGY